MRLNRFVPVRLLSWLDRYTPFCWVDVVSWMNAGKDDDYRWSDIRNVDDICFSGHDMCYCGKFLKLAGKLWRQERQLKDGK